MTPLAYVPAWHGDETVYSWCCAYHAVAGRLSARETGAALFGVEHACRERWAPLHLWHLALRTDGRLGTAADLLQQRTPLGLFWPFLSAVRRNEIRRRVDAPGHAGWTTVIGMPASALAGGSLRYCGDCVAQDLAEYGLARWRLPHQLAGVWACKDHGKPLKVLHSSASLWLVPGRSVGHSHSALGSNISVREMSQIVRLAQLAARAAQVDEIDLDGLGGAVLALLRAKGVTGWAVPIHRQSLSTWFSQTPVASALRHVQTSEKRLASGGWIHDLLRRRCADHPLKWMLLWVALHQEDRAEDMVAGFLAPASGLVAWDLRGQGSLWPTTHEALAAQICTYLADAVDLKSAARGLGLSTFALRRHLSAQGMHAHRVEMDLQWERRRQQGLRTIREFIQSHPGCSRTDVHNTCKASVAWLSREVPTELFKELACIPGTRSGQISFDFGPPGAP